MLGPSGCGKSTLLSIIGGLTSPDEGEVRIAGRPVTGPDPRQMAMVFQDPGLFPWRTALENVEFGLELQGVSGRDAARAGPGAPRAGRAPRLRGPLSARALGRDEAARRHRPRARARRAHPPHGRALRRARRADAAPHGRVAPRDLGPDAEDRRLRDPQPPGGDPALPAHRGHDGAPGPDQGELRGDASGAARPGRRRPPRRSATRSGTRSATSRGARWTAAREARSSSRGSAVLAGLLAAWELLGRARAIRSSTCRPRASCPPSGALLRLEAIPTLPGHLGLTALEVLVAYLLAVGPGPRARLRPRPAPTRRRDLRAAPRGALRDTERRLVPVVDALLRPRARVEDRVRRAARLLPRGAGRSGGDPRRGPASPRGRARPRGGAGDVLRQGDPARDHGDARGRPPRRARPDGRRRARRRDPRGAARASAT